MTKIIIHINEGVVYSVFANTEIEYIVVDCDDNNDDPIIIGAVNTADAVVDNLNIQILNDPLITEQAQLDEHPWR